MLQIVANATTRGCHLFQAGLIERRDKHHAFRGQTSEFTHDAETDAAAAYAAIAALAIGRADLIG